MWNHQVVVVLIAIATLGNTDKLLRVQFNKQGESERLQELAIKRNLDLWAVTKDGAEVAIPESDEILREISSNFSSQVVVDDVQKKIKEHISENKIAEEQAKRFRSADSITSYFPRYEQVTKWLARLSSENDFVSVENIGRTYEGRMMQVLRITSGDAANNTKPAVFVTGGIHAREWLAVATVIYTIDRMVKLRRMHDQRIGKLLAKYDFYFSPVTNPDGYAFTFLNSYTRMWRKTRRPHGTPGCFGGDPNRNFDIEFGKRGASTDPCTDIYPGPHAFSESCTQNIRDFVLSSRMRNRIKLFYDVHAYSQMYFVPYSFNKLVKPSDDKELRRVAAISNEALRRVNGRQFQLGTPGEILYDASGSTMDWFKLKANVKYVYGFEVFPDSHSTIAFFAKPHHIKPSGKEISEAIFTAAEHIRI